MGKQAAAGIKKSLTSDQSLEVIPGSDDCSSSQMVWGRHSAPQKSSISLVVCRWITAVCTLKTAYCIV